MIKVHGGLVGTQINPNIPASHKVAINFLIFGKRSAKAAIFPG